MGYKIIKWIIIVVSVLVVIFIASISLNAKSTNDTEKIQEEVGYLDTKLLDVIENLNSGDEEIDWETIGKNVELLYSSWSTIILDLYKTDISSDNILKFSDKLDDVMISIKNEDKESTIMYVASLYSYLPIFLEKSEADSTQKNIQQIKSYAVNAYAYVEKDNWKKVGEEINKAEEMLVSMINNVDILESNNEFNINKSYILLEELKNSLSIEDKEIFFIKYTNLMEELNVIS